MKQVIYQSAEMRQAIKEGFTLKQRKPSKIYAKASTKIISARDIVVIIALAIFLHWLRQHLRIQWV